MSDNGALHKRPVLKKQSELDTDNLQPLRTMTNPTTKIEEVEVNRRDSNDSTDSQNLKKPASLNEIQDLYSALQDLVNVTTTPVPVRRHPYLKSASCDNSPHNGRIHERTLTVPEKALRKLSSKISPSSSFEKCPDESLKHKRGLSVGTLDVVNSIIRISPFPSRKFSHDIDVEKNKKSSNSKTTKKDKSSRSSNENNRKWKGAKLFNRLRSKSSAEEEEHEDDKSSEDGEFVLPIKSKGESNNRRLSEADALKVREKKNRVLNNSCPTKRKSLQEDASNSIEDNVKGIEQLVAALNLETTTDINIKSTTPTFISPEIELSKLESWFEKAAAEAVMHSVKPTANETESSSDANQSPNAKNSRSRKKSNNNRRAPAIRRAASNAANTGRAREERKERRAKLTSNSIDAVGLNHCKSTPDLSRDLEEDVLNNADTDVTHKVLGRLNHFTENNLKETFTEKRKTSKISLEGNVGRLPDVPLFYVPTTAVEESGNNLKMVSTSSTDNNVIIKQCDGGMFYSEDKNNTKNLFDRSRCESVSNQTKRNNIENKELNKSRPKSMFDYFDRDVLIEEKDNVRNSLHIDTGFQTDNNANFCRAKILNSSHTLSLCDLSKNTVVQEKSLWERFRKGASNKKSKAIMA